MTNWVAGKVTQRRVSQVQKKPPAAIFMENYQLPVCTPTEHNCSLRIGGKRGEVTLEVAAGAGHGPSLGVCAPHLSTQEKLWVHSWLAEIKGKLRTANIPLHFSSNSTSRVLCSVSCSPNRLPKFSGFESSLPPIHSPQHDSSSFQHLTDTVFI